MCQPLREGCTTTEPSQQAPAQCLTQSLGKGSSSGKHLTIVETNFCCESINAARSNLVLLEAKAMTLVYVCTWCKSGPGVNWDNKALNHFLLWRPIRAKEETLSATLLNLSPPTSFSHFFSFPHCPLSHCASERKESSTFQGGGCHLSLTNYMLGQSIGWNKGGWWWRW